MRKSMALGLTMLVSGCTCYPVYDPYYHHGPADSSLASGRPARTGTLAALSGFAASGAFIGNDRCV